MTWTSVLNNTINFEVATKVLPTKGNLVYEYNPLRNYRLSKSMVLYKGSQYSLDELNTKFGITQAYDNFNKKYYWQSKDGKKLSGELPELIGEPGELVDFITDELHFDLEHPVNILPQYSYDGSVNLIINDGLNIPRLINTRFSATGKNTYEIIDRKGNNDTNIYDQGTQFDIDTSLYKRIVNIPKIEFLGVEHGGNLKIGNYHFYFKLADTDGNETDFVGESGLVSIFIGFDGPNSIHSGTKNENSLKSVKFYISNIDASYDNIFVYYSRYTSELGFNSVTEYVKIEKKFKVNNSGVCNIIINGFEETSQLTASDINTNYNVVSNAYTQATCQNMLFLGNVEKPHIPYKELADLSLRFLPYLKDDNYELQMTEDYYIQSSSVGYFDPKYIYEHTGYWDKEIYRLGIVYIMPNNELSPVFNIRGGNHIKESSSGSQFTNIPVYNKDGERIYINYHEESYLLLPQQDGNAENNPTVTQENVKGVVRFESDKDTNTVHGIDIRVDDATIQELKKYVKGYFFVRQSRIPTILAQGLTIGIDEISRTPTIPTKGGIIDQIQDYELDKTYIEVDNINDVLYVSEGFLSRYNFGLKAKHGFLNVVSSVLSYAATAVSFVPGGQLLSTVLNTASFVTSTIATGKFQVAAFVSSVASGVSLGLGKVIAKGADNLEKINKLLTKAHLPGAEKLSEIAKATTKIASGAQTAAESYRLSEQIIGGLSKKSYKGRYTKIPTGYEIKEGADSRKLTGDFIDRFILKDPKYNKAQGIICPDYELNQPYYNQIFTGDKHTVRYSKSQGINYYNYQQNQACSNYLTNNGRHFYMTSYYDTNVKNQYQTNIMSVSDNVKCVGLNNLLFRSRAGEAEEAFRYEYVSKKYDDSKDQINNTDIIRGSFGPYLACDSERLDPATIVDIMIPGYSEANMEEYFKIRMDDNSTFNAISDRIDIHKDQNDYLVNKNQFDNSTSEGYKYELYRGDCYLCQFTHRVNRNFNDPSAPYNDQIVDGDTWKNNYDPDNTEKYEQINLGDVNAVQLGMWITFKLRSSNNLNIRTLDGSNVDEAAMTGHERGYFPYQPMSTEGTFKHPESQIYNKGFTKSLSERWNFEIPDVPHIKNWFGTRIMYSDIHINDAYKNGFRVFQGTHYRDYTREYGEIIKLVSLESSLLCIFEHGVALIPVNERAIAGQGAGGNVYINTSNVLPENPKIISDMFGSQWPESILKVPGRTGDAPQYVYGVDTVAKKIWRTDGNTLECISDMKVQEFLNNNITLGERELTPKIGIRNVKTHYNAFKRDVMFTFYDNTYGFEEKVWNLCWNELLQKFITFYSWVPSYMENINNIPFSFNRDTSKWIAKLGTSHSDNSFADGITLNNVIVGEQNKDIYIKYIKKDGTEGIYKHTLTINDDKFVGALSLSNRVLPDDSLFYTIKYDLVRDNYGNWKKFEIPEPIDKVTIPDAKFSQSIPIYGLFLKEGYTKKDLYSELYYRNKEGHSYADNDINKTSYLEEGIENVLNYPIFKDITGKRVNLPREEMLNPDKIVTLLNIKATIQIQDFDENVKLGDDYYNMKAGFASGTTLVDAGYYESVVAVTPRWNLQFLSTDFWKHGQAGIIDIADEIYPTYWYGKQHPFEFECVVVNDPSVHKIFDNLELIANKAKPESFHYEIVGESYDFAKDKPNMYFRQEARKALWQYNGADICYNPNFTKVKLKQQPKSADLPHKYYSRIDTINEIEDYYVTTTSNIDKYDYKHLAGAEIVYYPNRQEFRIWNHVPAVAMSDLLDTTNHWDQSNGITVLRSKDNERNQEDVYKGTAVAKSYSGGRSIIGANCEYLEDRWKIQINPIVVCYKNEYDNSKTKTYLFSKENSTWANDKTIPRIPIYNSPIPKQVMEHTNGEITIPFRWEEGGTPVEFPSDNALTGLYGKDENNLLNIFDVKSWLQDNNTYGTSFQGDQNRKETDLRDKFIKVRIRYSGEELAVIDFLNTIYRISYA